MDHSEHQHDHHKMMANTNYRIEYIKYSAVVATILIFAWYRGNNTGLDVFIGSFMGGFFAIFGLSKLADLKNFASGFGDYDLIAERFRLYAWLYPFLQVGLGIVYLLNVDNLIINLVTLFISFVGAIGIARRLRQETWIRCLCLGRFIKLPLSNLSLAEDLLMTAMAAWMILG
jgi:hypothetical protein